MYALGQPDTGKRNVYDYYNVAGNDMGEHDCRCGVRLPPATVEAAISSFADIGADELIFNPETDDPEDESVPRRDRPRPERGGCSQRAVFGSG